METGLRDTCVLITGASGGIGQAVARSFAAEGARLVLHYHRNAAAAEQLRRQLDVPAIAVQADLALEPDAVRLFDEAHRAFGRIDSAVVNAAAWVDHKTPVHEMSVAQWDWSLGVVLRSAFLTCREFLRHLAADPRGDAGIVLIGSTAAIFGEEGNADYSAGKAALVYGLTLTLKNEIVRLAPRGRVNCVCPGWTHTAPVAAELADLATLARITATMPLRKIATPDDIASAVVFLASPRLAGHLSGTILPIAGGMEGRLLHSPAAAATD